MGLRTWLGLKKPRAKRKRVRSPPQIRIFRADSMDYTIFSKPQPPVPATYVDSPEEADIILASRPENLSNYGSLERRFMIWTAEPRFSLEQDRHTIVRGVRNPVHVMNVYTGLIYQDNYRDIYAHRGPVDFDEHMRAFAAKPGKVAMIATCRWNHINSEGRMYGGPLVIRGQDIDLTRQRDALAMHLYKQGSCDIYGRRWPSWITVSGESRGGNWWQAKRKILQAYSVNIAFENTRSTSYVTEKIWDAVAGATLPVYYGADNGVYRDFPRGSFIEAAGKTTDQLTDEILRMPKSERADRYEACLRAYIPVVREDRFAASRTALTHRTATFLEEIMSREIEEVPHLSA